MPKTKGWFNKSSDESGAARSSDAEYLRDINREVLQERLHKDEPANPYTTCKCGHGIGQHYPMDRAMPCRKCRCNWCECGAAEKHRRDMGRIGTQDVHPLPGAFRKGAK